MISVYLRNGDLAEVNAESIVGATLSRLARDGKFDTAKAQQAYKDLGVDTEKIDPARA